MGLSYFQWILKASFHLFSFLKMERFPKNKMPQMWQKILDFPLRLLFLPNRLQKSLSINLILSVLFEEFFQSTTIIFA